MFYFFSSGKDITEKIYIIRCHTLMTSAKNDQFCDPSPSSPSVKMNIRSIVLKQ